MVVDCGSLAARWKPLTLEALLHSPGMKRPIINELHFESKKWCNCMLLWLSLLKMLPALGASFFGMSARGGALRLRCPNARGCLCMGGGDIHVCAGACACILCSWRSKR